MKNSLLLFGLGLVMVGCGSSSTVDKSWSLALNSDKSKITQSQSVNLEANVTGYKSSPTYTWSDNNTTLSDTTAKITLLNLSIGNHHVTATVVNGDTNKSASKDIEVVDRFFVTISPDQRTFDRNVTLAANITGDTINPTFAWSEGTTVLGTDINLTKNDFNKSEHHVVLKVNDGDVNQTASLDFNVSDFSDLNVTTVSSDGVIIQKSTNLMWVSDMDTSKKACLAIHKDKEAEYNASKTFCQDLIFAGSDNWRKPSVVEIQGFITKTIAANVLPAYYAPCKFLIGVDMSNTQQVIITRYGQKAGFGNAGDVNGTFETVRQTKNIGLRCVRTVN